MFRKKENEFQYAPVIVKIIEDVTGGGTIARAELKGVIDELPPGVIVGVDSNGLYHVLKTAKVIGGTVSAPRIAKNHLLVVGEIISDGTDTLKIASITKGEEYDTLTFVDGQLTAVGGLIYLAIGINAAASVTLTGDVGDTLTISYPSAAGVEEFNGKTVELVQAENDTLAVSYANGKITIALADTTASKNNAAAIQAAIRALVAAGLDFTGITVTGGAGWDGGQTGAVLTTPSGNLLGGSYTANETGYKYAPEAITMNKIDTTVANQQSGLLVRGTVNEAVMPYPVDSEIKALMSLIRFV